MEILLRVGIQNLLYVGTWCNWLAPSTLTAKEGIRVPQSHQE